MDKYVVGRGRESVYRRMLKNDNHAGSYKGF